MGCHAVTFLRLKGGAVQWCLALCDLAVMKVIICQVLKSFLCSVILALINIICETMPWGLQEVRVTDLVVLFGVLIINMFYVKWKGT